MCQNERNHLRYRNECLTEFEMAIDKLQPLEDVNVFIRKERTPELTHRYAHALHLMDLLAEEIYGNKDSSGNGGSKGEGFNNTSSCNVIDADTMNDFIEGPDEVALCMCYYHHCRIAAIVRIHYHFL